MAATCDDWAVVFKALSDATRLKILCLLSDDEVCACDILEEVNITQPTLSYHMKMLCDCGLVEARRDPPWMKYTLNSNRLAQIQNFLDSMKNPSSPVKAGSCR